MPTLLLGTFAEDEKFAYVRRVLSATEPVAAAISLGVFRQGTSFHCFGQWTDQG